MIVGEVYVLFNVSGDATRQNLVRRWQTSWRETTADQEGEVYINVVNRDMRFGWHIILCIACTSKADVRVCIMCL